MPKIVLHESRCKGCGLCTIVCSRNLIVLSDKINKFGYTSVTITRMDECTGCKLCAEICPDVAITVFK